MSILEQKDVIFGAPEAALEPGRTSTSARPGRPEADRIFFIFSINNNLGAGGPRLGGMQAPSPPRGRGQSVVNNYEFALSTFP